LEVAAVLPADELAEAVGEGIAGRLVNRTVLEAVLARYRGLRGSARLAAVIGDESAMAITRSQAERAFLKLIRDARLPLPEVNARLGPYRPDFLWPEQRLIVELDSYTFHAGPDRFSTTAKRICITAMPGSTRCASPAGTWCTSPRWSWSGWLRRSCSGAPHRLTPPR
jgi:hypothetical protein